MTGRSAHMAWVIIRKGGSHDTDGQEERKKEGRREASCNAVREVSRSDSYAEIMILCWEWRIFGRRGRDREILGMYADTWMGDEDIGIWGRRY